MTREREIVTEFNQVTENYWTTHSEYNEVNALLIHWEDDELNVVPEVKRLQTLFEKDYRFNSAPIYPIPTTNSEAELQFELARFIRQHSLKRSSLTIVYYAGHADSPDESNPGYSKWRANLGDGPSLDWYLMQPALYIARGDVLVILDCCHAALKTRGKKEGKMELLAACGSGSRVPAPGKLSFTSILTRQLKEKARLGNSISVKSLHTHLWNDKLELTETPVYFDLSEHEHPSIVLQRLEPIAPDGFARKKRPATSFMILKVSLNDDPTGLQIADWLKTFPPSVIQDVNIEGLVLKARQLQEIQEYSSFFPGSVLGSLPSSAQSEILQGIWGLSQAVSSAALLAKDSDANINTSPLQGTSKANFAMQVVNGLQNKIQTVCDSIEEAVLLDSGISLDEAIKDEAIVAAEAGDSIKLTQTVRQYLLENSLIPNSLELPARSISFSSPQRGLTKSRFRFGRIGGKEVLVETIYYRTSDPESSEPSASAVPQIERMANQLSLPRQQGFSALLCIGYIQERHFKTFGIVFEIPRALDQDKLPVLLPSVYASKKRVPLNLRIKLAHSLAAALEHFHRVGWVHKEFKSDNILFFYKGSDNDLDLSQPWLFGFEFSRPEDAESDMSSDFTLKNNAYRHPERWGKPTAKFIKPHDIYSLGIICLELALWKPAVRFDEMMMQPLDPWKIKENLLGKVRKDIPHMAGQSMADAIDTCLRFKEITDDMSSFEMHQVFKSKVLGSLKKASADM